MPPLIYNKDGTIGVPVKGGGQVLIPPDLLEDLRAASVVSGLELSDAELLRELRFAGEPVSAHSIHACRAAGCNTVLGVGQTTCPDCGTERPTCNNCAGTGGFIVPTGDPIRANQKPEDWAYRRWKAYLCPVCGNRDAALLEALRRAGLPDPAGIRDACKDMWWGREGREQMGLAVQEYAGHLVLGEHPGMLTLVGNKGSGKSTMAQWIALACVKAGKTVTYLTSSAFKDMVSASIEADDKEPLMRLRDCQVLVLDELTWFREKTGAGSLSHTIDVLRDLINYRYERRRTLETVVVAKKSVWDDRDSNPIEDIYDRLADGVVAVTDIPSIRGEAEDAF